MLRTKEQEGKERGPEGPSIRQVWCVQGSCRGEGEVEQGWVQREPRAGSQVLEDPAFYLKSKGKPRSSITQLGRKERPAGRLRVERDWKRSGHERAVRAAQQRDGRDSVQGGGSRVREGIWDIPRGRINRAGRGPGGDGNGVNRVTFIKTNVYRRKKNPLLAVNMTGI